MPDTVSDAAAIASAVTGPNTPDNVSVSRPVRESVWTVMGMAIFAGVFAAAVAAILTWGPWAHEDARRINYLGSALICAVICIPIAMIALASSRLGRIEAKAGNNEIAVSGR